MRGSQRPSTEDLMDNERRRVSEYQRSYPTVQEPRSSRWRWLLVAILVLSVSIIMVIGASILGYYDGLKDREETLRIQALEHYRLGVSHLEDSNYALAQAEFEETLRLQPDLNEAWIKLQETQVRMSTIPTPTSALLPTAEPTAIPTEEPTNLDELLDQARESYRAGDYLEAVAYIEELLNIDPNYELAQVEDILFNCYYHQALALISEDRLEEAVHLLDLALTLRPEDATAQTERDLAAGYLSAVGYWAADWEQASQRFLALYQMRPDYKDVASRLYEARAEEAEYLESLGAWCDSAEWYALALEMRGNTELAAKRDEMVSNCEQNVPPPTTEDAAGHANGRHDRDAIGQPHRRDVQHGAQRAGAGRHIVLRHLGRRGTRLRDLSHECRRKRQRQSSHRHAPTADQPRRHPVDRAGAQRVCRRWGCIWSILAWKGRPALTMLTSHVDDLYPSFSPDDQQIIFTSNRMSERLWTLFHLLDRTGEQAGDDHPGGHAGLDADE